MKAGQVIARFKTYGLLAKRNQAEAAVKQTEANLEKSSDTGQGQKRLIK